MKNELPVAQELIDLEVEITNNILTIFNDLRLIIDNAVSSDEPEFPTEEIFDRIEDDKEIPNLLRNLKRYFQERD